MALAQSPGGENWPYLVRSLSIVEGTAAQEVLTKLATVDRAPDQPEPYRQVILRGLMLRDGGSRAAIALLEKWTDQKLSQPDESWNAALKKWQAWFAETYPNEQDATLPVETEHNNWTYQELLSYLMGPQGSKGDATKGSITFEKAQCLKCHRFDNRGDSVGPDLTTVSQRFQRKEILEAILFPSHVISDQYASQSVLTSDGRTVSGMVAPGTDGSLIVLQATGEKIELTKEEIENTSRSKTSAMPDGLLNPLTLEEIADLFAYLATAPKEEVARRPGGNRTR
jgi:putative heme-binding domain-containing protein